MYHQYFGLDEPPFSIAVNPRYLFMSGQHRDALAHMLYGVGVGGGFIMLTGEVGTGKTTIIRCLLEQLPENTDIAIVMNPALDVPGLLATVCDEFHLPKDDTEPNLKALTDKLHQFLLTNHRLGRNTVLLIDEAQHLRFDVLEQIRMLTNLETNTKKLLQIILVGQPELDDVLARQDLRQLSQRITARYKLKPLSLTETHAYIQHRLQVAGLSVGQQLFPPKVIRETYRVSGGVPRLINVLCDRMLLGAYGQNKPQVDSLMLKQAAQEVLGKKQGFELSKIASAEALWGALAVTTLTVVVTLVLLFWPENTPSSGELDEPSSGLTAAEGSEGAASDTKALQLSSVEAALIPSDTAAMETLLNNLGEPVGTCWQLGLRGLSCETRTVDNWEGFSDFNRPAVLTITTPGKRKAYVALLTLRDGQALVSSAGQQVWVPQETLGELWTGEFTFIWHRPEHFEDSIRFGDGGPMVAWLANKFAALDGQDEPLAGDWYNKLLVERVKLFQQEHDAKIDGVVGFKTLLKINEALAVDTTLDDFPKRLASPVDAPSKGDS